MPHVNYARGETVRFVFRREHGGLTHYTFHKGKGDSHKSWKRSGNRIHRAQIRQWFSRGNWESEPMPIDNEARDLWDLY